MTKSLKSLTLYDESQVSLIQSEVFSDQNLIFDLVVMHKYIVIAEKSYLKTTKSAKLEQNP